jgi:hypothetical protein
MYARLTRQFAALGADVEDVAGVVTLFLVLFVGLTLSGVA